MIYYSDKKQKKRLHVLEADMITTPTRHEHQADRQKTRGGRINVINGI